MVLYTRKGDEGETFCNIFGGRVPKDHIAIEFLGTLDEANSCIGVAISYIDEDDIKNELVELQRLLFRIGFTVSGKKSIYEDDLTRLEKAIDKYYSEAPLKYFILPMGDEAISHLHLARTIVRRAERRFITLSREVEINEKSLIMKILNRISDYIFALILYLGKVRGVRFEPAVKKDE